MLNIQTLSFSFITLSSQYGIRKITHKSCGWVGAIPNTNTAGREWIEDSSEEAQRDPAMRPHSPGLHPWQGGWNQMILRSFQPKPSYGFVTWAGIHKRVYLRALNSRTSTSAHARAGRAVPRRPPWRSRERRHMTAAAPGPAGARSCPGCPGPPAASSRSSSFPPSLLPPLHPCTPSAAGTPLR